MMCLKEPSSARLCVSPLNINCSCLLKMKRLDKAGCHRNGPLDLSVNTGSRPMGSDLCHFTSESGLLHCRSINLIEVTQKGKLFQERPSAPSNQLLMTNFLSCQLARWLGSGIFYPPLTLGSKSQRKCRH